MGKKGDMIKQQVAETLELPKDIIMDVPRLTVIGSIQLNIENHCGIIEYNSTSIRINTSVGVYKISGTNMIIKNITSEEIIITGEIENIDISN